MIGTDDNAVEMAVRALGDAQDKSRADVAALAEALRVLVSILIGRGVLNEGHARHLERIARRPDLTNAPKVRLRTYGDKYTVTGEDVDCGARMHLCKARCCTLKIELSTQDIEEGKLKWQLEQPYLLVKDADGYCSYLDRSDGRCGVHGHRPSTCREYTCRYDRRIWLDFDNRIPAPLPGAGQG
jgi:hypothetical protein